MAANKASSGQESVNNMRVKATVNRDKKSVVFVEADADLADVLFSYLTLPMATVISLISRKQPPAVTLGCFDNLYRSVEVLEPQHFWTRKCKEMLLRPRNGADAYCQYLKINVEKCDEQQPPYGLFRCDPSSRAGSKSSSSACRDHSTTNPYLSYDKTDVCRYGKKMTLRIPFLCRDVEEKGLFVKRLSRLVISDDLRVKPATTAATVSLLSEHGVSDATQVEELTFDFGINEALDLLKLALVSKTPLSDVLLNTKVAKKELSSKANFLGGFDHRCHRAVVKQVEDAPQVAPKDSAAASLPKKVSTAAVAARIKLVYSKTKNRVLYAEAGEDFVDLIFTFLLVPLGHMFKQMQDVVHGATDVIPSEGCMKNLYKSVQDLVAEGCIVGDKDDGRAPVLLRPLLAARYGYLDHPLGLKEVEYIFVNDKSASSSSSAAAAAACPVEGRGRTAGQFWSTISCVIKDPKLPATVRPEDPATWKELSRAAGYVSPSMYTVTDDLNISPISPASNLALLRKLNVPFSDIEDRIVHVGKQEASRLLMASLTSNSPLTAAFLGCACCCEKVQVGGATGSVDETARPTKRRTRSSNKN
ncbi:unnamed protein product [Linum trigynum]|uniref:Uncharacterized protein n=1 Tax=Linum trigynum TaxID=586398 RepID=A0AAV2C880_9ROSI